MIKSILKTGTFTAQRVPSFFDHTPIPSVIIVLQGKLDTDIAAHFEKEIGYIIDEIADNGHIILHGDAGDFGLSENIFHSDGLETIDSRGVKMFFDCHARAIPRNIQLILLLSPPLLQNRTLPFPIFYDTKSMEEHLQNLHALSV